MKAIAYIWSRLKAMPWIWSILVRVGRRTGLTPQNWVLLETMSRPWWFYRSKGRLVLDRVERRSPTPITSTDVALCERLLEAYELARGTGGGKWQTRGLWAWLFNMYQRELADALAGREPRDLARLLAAMFQKDFTHGLLFHAHVSSSGSWLGSRILSLRSLDMLVSLAEALGAIPAEGAEQRRAGLGFDGDVAELLRRIEHALGCRLEFPNVGAPFGPSFDGRLITLETPELVYAAMRLDRAIAEHLSERTREDLSIVEIGGGYGGMCYWYLQIKPDTAHYTIVDLPIMCVLQGYFLSRVLGEQRVSFHGEPAKQVHLSPDSALSDVPTPFQVMVNKDSMPEMPLETMVSYLEWGRANCTGFFYSYNHEVETEIQDSPAGQVAAAVRRIGGLSQVSRDQSWLRRGYAEEIYVKAERPVEAAASRRSARPRFSQPSLQPSSHALRRTS
jgi:hypothetical protein